MAIQFSRMALQADLVVAATTVMVLNTQVQAMEPNPNPYNITLPDGTTFTVHMTGSEDDPMEEDVEGFAVLSSVEGNGDYEYADVNADTGDVKQLGVKLSEDAYPQSRAGSKAEPDRRGRHGLGRIGVQVCTSW
jgi:hypothetical protein